MSIEKFKNKYRISSARAQWWDYGINAAYFITICTANRQCFLGSIVSANPGDDARIGNVADCRDAIYRVSSFHGNDANLGDAINRVSTIRNEMRLSPIGQIAYNFWNEIPQQFSFVILDEFVIMPNHIHGILIINNEGEEQNIHGGGFSKNKNPMLNDNLSRVVKWYKGRCSFEIRKVMANFSWQPRFYDHIIRDKSEYLSIANYIFNNPANWEKDTNYSTD